MKVKKNPQIYLQSGNFLANQGKHEEALTEFYKYVDIDPTSAFVWNNIGVAKLCLGHAEEAIENFNKAIEIDRTYRDGFHNRGLAYSDLDELDLALSDLDKACLLYTSPSPRDGLLSRMPSSA